MKVDEIKLLVETVQSRKRSRRDRQHYVICSHCAGDIQLETARCHSREFWDKQRGEWKETKNGQPAKPVQGFDPDTILAQASRELGDADVDVSAEDSVGIRNIPAARLVAASVRRAWNGLDRTAVEYGADSSDDEDDSPAFDVPEEDSDVETLDSKEIEAVKPVVEVLRPQLIKNAVGQSTANMVLLLLLKAFVVFSGVSEAAAAVLLLLVWLLQGKPTRTAITLYNLDRWLEFDKKESERLVVCKTCSCVRRLNDCIITRTDHAGNTETQLLRCDHVHYREHPHHAKREQCNAQLVRLIKRKAMPPRITPVLSMPFRPLLAPLARLLQRPEFEDELDHWRVRFRHRRVDDAIIDVHDGRLWHEFQTLNGEALLSDPGTIAVCFFGDWIQPFASTSYSMGNIMLALCNLPRRLRFKRDNIILSQVFPGGSEKVDCQRLLVPFVEDLLALFKGVRITTHKYPQGRNIRVILLQCIADAPAMRKLLAFVGVTATCGCFRCTARFPAAAGSSASAIAPKRNFYLKWKDIPANRTRADIEAAAEEWRLAESPAKRKQVASRTGCKDSAFLLLPYFNAARAGVIGAMHNLYLGSMKVAAVSLLLV